MSALSVLPSASSQTWFREVFIRWNQIDRPALIYLVRRDCWVEAEERSIVVGLAVIIEPASEVSFSMLGSARGESILQSRVLEPRCFKVERLRDSIGLAFPFDQSVHAIGRDWQFSSPHAHRIIHCITDSGQNW